MTEQSLTNLINNFSPKNLTAFFRAKRLRNFSEQHEKLSHLSRDSFSNVERIGFLKFSEVEGLIVYTIKVEKDLTERSGKKAQFDLGKEILKQDDNLYDGIFAFYDANGNFRLSLIYANYYGTRRKLFSFRRFTYYVSPALTNKTFIFRMGEGDFTTLDNIKETFSVEKVTKDFYKEISYWYFWACQKCQFPEAAERDANGRQESVIRMITRLIFIWFMREKGLVPNKLFEKDFAQRALTDLDNDSSTYYLAILQNLFFATLNTPNHERKFRSEVRVNKGYNPDFNNQYVYRYHSLFKQPEEMESYFQNIPFLNGGLFDCLDDKELGYYLDGFTESAKKNRPIVPNELFFSSEIRADFNSELGTTKKRYSVEGLFTILSRYNFTIDENTVDDKEIALDPEMLGRVFENLLASFNPETSSTARKATGSYYTPREIVDYMVDESLTTYLRQALSGMSELEQKLDWLFSDVVEDNPFTKSEVLQIIKAVENVRIVDPAVGSGAFPMGALHRMVSILSRLDPASQLWQQAQLDATESIPDPQIREQVQDSIRNYFLEKNPDYGRKLFLIQKCIYGVDIQPIAVEIAKLRFFISLLVEETVEKDKPNWGIEPLPNLDFKIMQGNSLISVVHGIDFSPNAKMVKKEEELFSGQDERSSLIKLFQSKKEVYQSESDHKRKHELQAEIDQLLIDLAKSDTLAQQADYARELARIDRKYEVMPASKEREDAIKAEKQKVSVRMGIDLQAIEDQMRQRSKKQRKRDFFPWSLYFAEVFSEKDGFDIVLGNPPYIGEKGNRGLFAGVKTANLKLHYMGKMDFFYFFFHLALDLCRSHGSISFITTNYYLTATGACNLRKDFKHRSVVERIINFNELKIFESALGQHNMITLLTKRSSPEAIATTCITSEKGSITPELLSGIFSGANSCTEYFRVRQEDLFDGEDSQIRLQGIIGESTDGLNRILWQIQKSGQPLSSICNINQGIITGADKVSQRHINKYHVNAKVGGGIFVISENEFENLQFNQGELKSLQPWFKNSDIKRWTTAVSTGEKVFYLDRESESSSSVLNHLFPYKDLLSDRREVENGVIQWWQLQWPRSAGIFQSKKVVAPQRSRTNTFGYNEVPWYASADVYFITEADKSINLKYVLALLNSKTYYLWLYHRGKRKGETLELYQTPLSQVPIPKISPEQQAPFVQIVDEILSLHTSGEKPINTLDLNKLTRLESELDQMVYALFDFTESEINFIEAEKRS